MSAKQSLNVRSVLFDYMNVALVRWPDDAETREVLHQAGHPRILLLTDSSGPPAPVDDLEDWVRLPVIDADLVARAEWLNRRVNPEAALGERPVLDGDGRLNTDAGWASLPPVEARLTQALIDRYGTVVSRDALAHAGWPRATPDRNTLDVQVLRLRRRITPIGLAIRTVRSRGYVLERTSV
jgi:DNA-binding response OmpR family regulator